MFWTMLTFTLVYYPESRETGVIKPIHVSFQNAEAIVRGGQSLHHAAGTLQPLQVLCEDFPSWHG